MMTNPDRPTTGGLQSPVGVPVQLVQALYLKSTVVEVHAEYLTMLEKMEKRNVNYFEMCLESKMIQLKICLI